MADVLALQRQGRAYYNTITGNKDDTDDTNVRLNFQFDKSFGNKLAGMVGNPLKPTLKELNTNQKELAEMIKVGTVYDKKGANEAIKRLNDNLPNYTLDAELSNSNYIVVKKPNGKIVVAFRGTNLSGKIKSGLGKGLNETWEWLFIQSGHEQIFDEHKIQPIKDALLRKYRPNQIETITGYSMGGTKAHTLGDVMGIKTTLFNPYLGKNFFNNALSPNTQHEIIRTTEDIATAQALFTQGVSKLPKNVKVSSIDPVITVKSSIAKLAKGQGPLSIYNIVQTHNLENFTQSGDRTSIQRNVNEIINERVQKFNNETVNVSPAQRTRLQTEMLSELEPNLRLMSQDLDIHLTPATKLFKSLKPSNIVSALAGLGVGVEVDNAISEIEQATGVKIDDHITTALVGGLSAVPVSIASRFLGGKLNLMRSIKVNVAGALTQEIVSDTTNALLLNAGVSPDVAEITSQTLGGGAGGVVTASGGQIARQVGIRVAAQVGPRVVALFATQAVETAGIAAAETAALAASESVAFAAEAGIAAETAGALFATEAAGALFATETAGLLAAETAGILAAETAGVVAAELGAIAVATEVGSAIPIFGTLIGLVIGASIAGGIAIADVVSRNNQRNARINAPITPQEQQFADSLISYMSISDDSSATVLNQMGITEEIQVDRIRGIMEAPEYQQRISNVRQERGRTEERFLQEEGISEFAVSAIDNLIQWTIPEFNTLTNKQRNIRFSQVASDPRNASLVGRLQFGPRWDESTNDPNARNFRTPIEVVKNFHLIPPTLEVPEPVIEEVPVVQKIPIPPQPVHARGSHAINVINADPQVRELMGKRDFYAVNKRIRDIFMDNSSQSSFGDTVIYGDTGLPQINDTGAMVYQKYDDPPAIPPPTQPKV